MKIHNLCCLLGPLMHNGSFQANGGALLNNVRERGEQLRTGLEELKDKYPDTISGIGLTLNSYEDPPTALALIVRSKHTGSWVSTDRDFRAVWNARHVRPWQGTQNVVVLSRSCDVCAVCPERCRAAQFFVKLVTCYRTRRFAPRSKIL